MTSEFDDWRQDVIQRLTRVETNLTNHLDSQERKFNKTTIVLGVVMSFIGLVAVFK